MTVPLFAKKTRSSEDYRPSFVEKLNEGKRKTGGLTEAESAEFDKVLARNNDSKIEGLSLYS